MNERDICTVAIETWGAEAQTRMLFEEMGELMQAVCKVGRVIPCDREMGLPELLAHVAEEIADVEIVLHEVKLIYSLEDAVQEQKEYKLARLATRVEQYRRDQAGNM